MTITLFFFEHKQQSAIYMRNFPVTKIVRKMKIFKEIWLKIEKMSNFKVDIILKYEELFIITFLYECRQK